MTIAWVLIAPELPIRGFFQLAVWAKVPAPIQGAEFLLYRARPLLTSLLLKLLCASFLLWVAASMPARAAPGAGGVLGLRASSTCWRRTPSVNPTTDPRLIATPAWTQQIPA